MYFAEVVDAWRVVPRAILIAYGMMVWQVFEWYMALSVPSTQQAALVTTVAGTVAAIIGLYQHSGRKWGFKNGVIPVTPGISASGGGGARTYARSGTKASGNYGDN